ncbi:hypothetical protein [Cupriavidus oxalaticus]|uniref:hypothetical protein n=1 Tax=Cupriavidus oxalaticus TaxID=96344 RepID=UPI003180EB9A
MYGTPSTLALTRLQRVSDHEGNSGPLPHARGVMADEQASSVVEAVLDLEPVADIASILADMRPGTH